MDSTAPAALPRPPEPRRRAARRLEPRRLEPRQLEPRKLGMWLFIASEVIFFSGLITAYAVYHPVAPRPHGIDVLLVSANTFLLLCSSYTMVRALAAVQAGERRAFRNFLLATIALGSVFLGVQAYEYSRLVVEGVTPASGLFGSTFFGLTGFHGAHVALGVIWLLIVLVKGQAGAYGPGRTAQVELAGLYWHFVDLVWVVLFMLIYLIP